MEPRQSDSSSGDRHVRLLGILASVWGALSMLVGAAMLLLSAGALAVLIGPRGESVALAAGLTAATFATIGVFALLWGGAHAWAAVMMRRRRPAGRVLMLALGVINLLVLPFGTALGIYALWALLTHEGRQLFHAPAAH